MRILLVNSNRYHYPPVIPVGLEYLLAPLERAGHTPLICDPSFKEDPAGELVRAIEGSKPDAIGISARNLDTAVHPGSSSFLRDAAELVRICRETADVPLIAGGSATLCSTLPLLESLGADYLVAGPGEKALPELLDTLQRGGEPGPVVDGWSRGIEHDITHRRGSLVDYGPYLEGDGLVGVESRKGCRFDCPFCVERLRPSLDRDIDAVITEFRSLAEKGLKRMFICDSEVNQDLERAERLLSTLVEEEMGLDWTGYFRPVPFSRKTARLVAGSGCGSLTLSVNSWEISSPDEACSAADVERFISWCADEGIKVAVDLLVGYPGESRESIEAALDLLERARPATVGVGRYIRLYDRTPVLEAAYEEPERLLGTVEDNPGLLMPVFYDGVDGDWLDGRMEREALFRPAAGKGVNYQRL